MWPKRLPCSLLLRIFISNSGNFNRRKYKETDPMPK